MGRVGRDVYRRKLERLLAHSIDEPMIALFSAVSSVQAGNGAALDFLVDLPEEAVGAEIGSPYHIPPWTLETLANELLATPKPPGFGIGRTRLLRADMFASLRMLAGILVKLENAEDGVYLGRHDVFYEMARIAQRQFPWQRGVLNAPHLYRSLYLYGSGSAGQFFEESAGLSISDFVMVGAYLSAVLAKNEFVDRRRSLEELGISAETREAALRRLCLPHAEARRLASMVRARARHSAYRPSLLRDYPIISFGRLDERLRAPIAELITYRYTTGLYLDVVNGGASVWTEIGSRFEQYVCEYLGAMMKPCKVDGESSYGTKKRSYRTPDVLVSDASGVVAAIECKAKRMSFDARFADDPVAAAALGFDEISKGIFQLWRFLAHARRGLTGTLTVAPDCQPILVTADSWLTMARPQARAVIAAAHQLADEEGDIPGEDRRDVAFCPIEDVEYALQLGDATSFLSACREVAAGDKQGWIMSVAHTAVGDTPRPYPFRDRVSEILPWMTAATDEKAAGLTLTVKP